MHEIISKTERLSEVVRCQTWSSPVRLLLLWGVSLLGFVISELLAPGIHVLFLRATSALILLIIIPGTILSCAVLTKNQRRFWSTILLGLAFQVVMVNSSMLLRLIMALQMALAPFLLITSSALTIGYVGYSKIVHEELCLVDCLAIPGGRKLYIVAAAALLVRAALVSMSTGSIGNDGALYADVARHIVNGEFTTNVINDTATETLWNSVIYCAHQGVTYLFAVSWLIFPPNNSGPTLVLTIAGLILVLLSHDFASRYFGSTAGLIVAITVAFHPLFLFYSVVPHGPEIMSLAFALGFLFILSNRSQSNRKEQFIAGVFLGLVDVIWYPNSLMFLLALPFFRLLLKPRSRRQAIIMTSVAAPIILGRIFITTTWILILAILLSFSLPPIFQRIMSAKGIDKNLAICLGIWSTILYWRWPTLPLGEIQVNGLSLSSIGSVSAQGLPQINLDIFLRPIPPAIAIGYLFLLFFHITPVLFCVLLTIPLFGNKKRKAFAFLIVSIIGAVGTLFIFVNFSTYKQVLIPQYVYSHARFFLSLILMILIALGSIWSRLPNLSEATQNTVHHDRSGQKNKRTKIIIALVLIGFVPSILYMPSAFAFASIEKRYGWQNLPNTIDNISNQTDVFLVDRAREFSWLTNRKSVELHLGGRGAPTTRATASIIGLSTRYNASYLLMDSHTIARWNTLTDLLTIPIELGQKIPLNVGALLNPSSLGTHIEIKSLELQMMTQENESEVYARIYSLQSSEFQQIWYTDNLGGGWLASRSGQIINGTRNNQLIIGGNETYTNTWREANDSLDVDVNGGFLLVEVEEINATIPRATVRNKDYTITAMADRLSDTVFYYPLGDFAVGDIRIVCEGNPGEMIAIKSMSIWQAV